MAAPIHISVEPAQTAFFAGESLVLRITLANTLPLPAPDHVDDQDYLAKTINIIWSYVHIQGSFSLDPELVKSSDFEALKVALFLGGLSRPPNGYGSPLLDSGIGSELGFVGGGSLEHSSDYDSSHLNAARRVSSAPFVPAGSPHLGSLEQRRLQELQDKTLPLFRTPPSVLAIDTQLAPQERQTFLYQINLPFDLPPSFQGKSIQFEYNAVVGICRSPNSWLGECKPTSASVSPLSTPAPRRSSTYFASPAQPPPLQPSSSSASKSYSSSGTSPIANVTPNRYSKIVKMPICIYNYVSPSGARPFYDLTNPILWHRDEARVIKLSKTHTDHQKSQNTQQQSANKNVKKSQYSFLSVNGKRSDSLEIHPGRADFDRFAFKLLAGFVNSPINNTNESSRTMQPDKPSSPQFTYDTLPAHQRPEILDRYRPHALLFSNDSNEYSANFDNDQEMNCIQAVNFLTHSSRKSSFDIKKDGYMVASLTLPKTAFRLGDAIDGVIHVNIPKEYNAEDTKCQEARIVRVAARLESHELVETSISTRSAAQIKAATKHIYSQYHNLTLDSARVPFTLLIPADATPDFSTSGVKMQWTIRLSFLVKPPPPQRRRPVPETSFSRESTSPPSTKPKGHTRFSSDAILSKSTSFITSSTPKHSKRKSLLSSSLGATTALNGYLDSDNPNYISNNNYNIRSRTSSPELDSNDSSALKLQQPYFSDEWKKHKVGSSLSLSTSSSSKARKRHSRSTSFAFGTEPLIPISNPIQIPTGIHHLMPSPQISLEDHSISNVSGKFSDHEQSKTVSFDNDNNNEDGDMFQVRAMPKTVVDDNHVSLCAIPDLSFNPVLFLSSSTMDLSNADADQQQGIDREKDAEGKIVLMPSKLEMVECSFPISVYPTDALLKPQTLDFNM